jgi:hypothetical protein
MKTLRRNFDSFRGATVVSLIPVEWQLREYANIKIGSVGRSEVELLSGLHIECRVPCVELAHGNCLPVQNDFSGDQQFFLAFAQTLASKSSEAALRQQVSAECYYMKLKYVALNS